MGGSSPIDSRRRATLVSTYLFPGLREPFLRGHTTPKMCETLLRILFGQLMQVFHFLSDDHGSTTFVLRFRNGPSVGPFPLRWALPTSLDGRDAVEYYGPAAPPLACGDRSTYPILREEPGQFRRCSTSNLSVSFRRPSVALAPSVLGRRAVRLDAWSNRTPSYFIYILIRKRDMRRPIPIAQPSSPRSSPVSGALGVGLVGHNPTNYPQMRSPWSDPMIPGLSDSPLTGSP
jgi:hypothetical protein